MYNIGMDNIKFNNSIIMITERTDKHIYVQADEGCILIKDNDAENAFNCAYMPIDTDVSTITEVRVTE